jgi:hypothetical protein
MEACHGIRCIGVVGAGPKGVVNDTSRILPSRNLSIIETKREREVRDKKIRIGPGLHR